MVMATQPTEASPSKDQNLELIEKLQDTVQLHVLALQELEGKIDSSLPQKFERLASDLVPLQTKLAQLTDQNGKL